MLNHIFSFGLLTVSISAILRDPKTGDLRTSIDELTFEVDYVRNEHGHKISASPQMLDSIEVYFEAMLPAILRSVEVSVISKGASSISCRSVELSRWTNWYKVAVRAAKDSGWNIKECEIKVQHLDLESSAARASEAKRDIDSYLANRYENGRGEAYGTGHTAPRFKHTDWEDAEIGMSLASQGIFI